MSDSSINDLTFNEAMTELEGIVGVLETGTLELEQSLEKYSRGVALLANLQDRLNDAEQKIEVLMGELAEAPSDDVQDTTLLKA
ncbi:MULTISPECIES: exodeoxyribonuclease VII small subunit [unclassified Adlercreutzia]|uniref:exodeoxyribonuclease VII small subunit n=1 Tax=unclassified Adlercreutzia TaxID=2636013 RepID=UPI0013ED76B6|nr:MULTISPECIES: exodeoxyribonuclease VII small subunit [unclassified Adlercreutzia]